MAEAPDRMDYILQNLEDLEDNNMNDYNHLHKPNNDDYQPLMRKKSFKKFTDKFYFQHNDFVYTKYPSGSTHWWSG